MMDCFRLLGGVAVAAVILAQPISAQEEANEPRAGQQAGGDQLKGFKDALDGVMAKDRDSGQAPAGTFALLDGLKKIEEQYGSSTSPEVQERMVGVYDLMMDIHRYRQPDARKLLELADSVQKRYADSTNPVMKDFLPYARFMEAEALFFLGANDEAREICREIRKNHYGAQGAETDFTLSALYKALLLEIRLDVWEDKLQEALDLCALGYFKAIGQAGPVASKMYRITFDNYNNMWCALAYEKMGREKEADFVFQYRMDKSEPRRNWNVVQEEAWADANMLGAMNRYEEAARVLNDMAGMMRRDLSEEGQLYTITALMNVSRIYDETLASKDRAAKIIDEIAARYGDSKYPRIKSLVRELERFKASQYDGFSSKQMIERFNDDSKPEPGEMFQKTFHDVMMERHN